MKLVNIFIFILISLNVSIKVNSNEEMQKLLRDGGKLIFIRHAYTPGNGDPENFNIKDCNTQRNLDYKGKKQSKELGLFFKNKISLIESIFSSEWCRCKETSFLAYNNYQTKSFLNSFYDNKFAKNKDSQINELKKFIEKQKIKKNFIFVTHYVVISEILDYYPKSGEIIVSDRNFNVLKTFDTKY